MTAENHPPDESQRGAAGKNGTVQEGQSDPERGLPRVEPPSGRFIAQLFLIPGLIVLVLVLIWLAGNYLVSEKRNPEYFLTNLDSPNEDIRWRAASDLAQVLKRPESLKLASDPVFALEIADRLETALEELERREQGTAERTSGMSEKDRNTEWAKLRPLRNYVLFLISCQGDFTVPVGAPLLCRIALDDEGVDLKERTLRRRRAVWALANLGQNVKRFKEELAKPDQEEVLAVLKQERKSSEATGEWAEAAYLYLAKDKTLYVDIALEKCSDSEDVFLRELVAMALNFWEGPRVIPTLLKLSNDDGHGTRIRVSETD